MRSLLLFAPVFFSCLVSFSHAFVLVDPSSSAAVGFSSKSSSLFLVHPSPELHRRHRRPILFAANDDEETRTEEVKAAQEEEDLPKKEDPELVALKQEIANLESALKAKKRELFSTRDKVEEYSKEGYARQVAEMENMRRARSMLNSSNRSSATANILAEFVPILDRLNELKSKYTTTSFGKQYDALPSALQSAFSELGAREFSIAVGNKVDRYRMLVVDEQFSDQHPKGTVLEVNGKKGLELQGNVIRMAECVMSLGPEPKEEEEEQVGANDDEGGPATTSS